LRRRGRDEFEEIGLAFEEVGEEIGIARGQGAELVEECLFGLRLLAERKARVAVHESVQAAWARWRATHSEIAVARFVAGCWKFKMGAGNLQQLASSIGRCRQATKRKSKRSAARCSGRSYLRSRMRSWAIFEPARLPRAAGA
jgi:hypothetical protein